MVFVKLILGKMWVDRVTRQRREIHVRCELDLKVILKGLECNQRFLPSFLIEFPSNKSITFIVSVRLILPKVGVEASHNGKVTLDKKMIFISHQRCKSRNRDHQNHFSVTLETAGNFLFLFVRLILGKKGVDRVTGPQWEIYIRYESHLQVILKDLGCKQRFFPPFLVELLSIN